MGLKKLGRFQVTIDLLETEPENIRKVMSNFLVLRAETFYPDYIEYLAYSPLFEEIKEGSIAPFYMVNINFDLSISLKKL